MMFENSMPILLADDDVEDQEMTRRALSKTLTNEVYLVADGEELLDFLHHRGKFAPAESSPTPGLILLDLNMPRKDGREVLSELKADPQLRRIPVVVLTTSKTPDDVAETYELGGSSFITKPPSLSKLANIMSVLGDYWFKTVRLPAVSED